MSGSPPSAAAAAFETDVRGATVRNLRLAASIGMFVVPTFWLLDRVVLPELATLFVTWRLGAAAMLGVTVAATYAQEGRRNIIALGYLALLSAALPVSAMVAYVDPGVSPYYAGLCLAMLFNGVLFPWNPVHTAAVNCILLVSFLAPVAAAGGPRDVGGFVNNTFFLVVTAVVSTVSAWSLFREHRRRFDLSWSLELRSADLAEANERLREVDELKSRFFANVSHELRTPLTLAISPVEALLSNPTLPESLRDTFHALHVDLLALRRRIEDLIDLARLDSGKLRIGKNPVDVARIVTEVATAARPFAARHHVALDVDTTPGLETIAGDSGIIEQVVFNLVSNALKFTPAGGRVGVSLGRQEGSLVLEVADSGPGISPDETAELFTRFGRTATSPSARGLGLGLALVKEFTELHGGTVSVRSVPGQGATFTVTLPLGGTGVEALPETRPWQLALDFESELSSRDAGAPRTPVVDDGRPVVLVVDDNARLRRFVAGSLEDEYLVVEAGDGQEALERLDEVNPLVVVADMMMPRLDGRGLVDAIRSDPRFTHLPVLLLTAHGDAELRDEALEHGASDYLTKPFSVRELRARVRNFVVLRSSQQALASTNEALALALEESRSAHLRVLRAEKLAAIGQLAAGIGHEVKNPVNFLLNFARPSRARVLDLARRVPEGEWSAELGRVGDALGRVVEGGERIAQIVEGLQGFARGGQARTAVDVDEEVRVVHRMMERSVPAGVEVRLLLCGSGRILGSPVGVGAVVLNLVTNAVHALPDGGVVSVETTATDTGVTLRVLDNGVGMAPDVQARIWDPFFTTRNAGDGLGLGLALVQRIVTEELGGRIRVDSTPGAGTVFTVELPRQSAVAGHDLARSA